MSQSEFARLVGISKGEPSNVLSGRHKPPSTVEKLTVWGDVLGLRGKELDDFIVSGLLEHTPDLIRERYLAMHRVVHGGGGAG